MPYVDVGDATIEESETEDVDWVNNWKQYFHQFYIDDILDNSFLGRCTSRKISDKTGDPH